MERRLSIKKGWVGFIAVVAVAAVPVFATAAEQDYSKYFKPIPASVENADNPSNQAKIDLGRMLFFDPRLSKSGFISCNSCHNLITGGVDNLSTSIGHMWQIGPRNAPTVYNAALNVAQFWDGRAKDVEEQAQGPITNPGEMAATQEMALDRVMSMPAYVTLFKEAFKGEATPITYVNLAKAIGAYERTLLTPSRFDDFLAGKKNALTDEEKKGLDVFVGKGCVACHNGAGIGGRSFQKFDYGTDMGRYEVTKNAADKKFFRVASLRNVTLTYPYFHDGKVWNLEEAVKIMGEKQMGVKLSDDEVRSITEFLGSLSMKQASVEIPMLPPSTDRTSKPDVK
ncbi:MAG: cytochrome-c peroxidase [Nitrospirota bacterium]|nr:cytochrome-c peroxidase [Nitrospirota bacterium]